MWEKPCVPRTLVLCRGLMPEKAASREEDPALAAGTVGQSLVNEVYGDLREKALLLQCPSFTLY